MNYARIATAAVAAWVVSIGIGFLVNEVLLRDLDARPMLPRCVRKQR